MKGGENRKRARAPEIFHLARIFTSLEKDIQ